MGGRELLSDIEGMITHILLGCNNPLDFSDLVSIRSAFDENVKVSIMYSTKLEEMIDGLKKRMDETGKEVHYYPLDGEAPIWMQDRLHVFKGKTVMSSISIEESKRRREKNERDYTTDKTDIIFESDFWKENGFEIIPNDLGLYNSDAGEIIAAEKKLFVGSRLATEYAYHDLKRNVKSQEDLLALQDELADILKQLDPSRELVFVGVNGVSAGQHIDCFFTPLNDNQVAVQLPHMTREKIELPTNFKCTMNGFQHYWENLNYLARFFMSIGYDVLPMAGLPPMNYFDGDRQVNVLHIAGRGLHVSKFLIPYMTYNNIVQEVFPVDGEVKRRVYSPCYDLDKSIFEDLHQEKTYKNLMQLNDMAERFYENFVDNAEIRKINLGYRASLIGSVRCSVKVLERS